MAAHGRSTVAAVLVAAGDGRRLGADLPKAFVTVAGRTLLEHAVTRFAGHPDVRDLVVVVPPALVESTAQHAPGHTVVPGGPTRQRSVARGLAALADDVTVVLVHDVARPFVPAEVISRVLAALAEGADGVVPVMPVTDTLRECGADGAIGAPVDRSGLVGVQTPQGFRRDVLERAHHGATTTDATDDAVLVEALGGRLVPVPGSDLAFKITHPVDLHVAEAILARR